VESKHIEIFLAVLACLANFSAAASVGDYEELCRLFKNGTLIRKPGTCNQYIECYDGEGTLQTCPSDQSFDSSKSQCVETLENSHLYCGNRCEGKDGVWVSDPTECHKYFYCRDGVSLAGMCPGYQHFNETSQSCMHGEESICVDVNNICEILPDKMKFRNEDDCASYYECKSGVHVLNTCITDKSRKYFDVESGNCVEPNKVDCAAHSTQNVCSASKTTVFKSDGATCRGYFLCKALEIVEDLEPIWLQCPEGYFFDEERQVCGKANTVVCTHNRCDGRGTSLVASSSNNCHNYIRCVDNKEVEEDTCHFDHFFDEAISACSSKIIYDKCCDGRD
ncbi:hypothetical protein KR074_002284, partial [Drosophila pseudoananassae]